MPNESIKPVVLFAIFFKSSFDDSSFFYGFECIFYELCENKKLKFNYSAKKNVRHSIEIKSKFIRFI